MRRLLAPLLLCVSMVPRAGADLGFPESVKFPPQIVISPDQPLVKEDLAEVEFESNAAGSAMVTKRGLHYARWFTYKPAAGEPALGYYNGSEERIWKAVQGALAGTGWTVVFVNEGHSAAVFKLVASGTETWMRMKMDAPQAAVNFESIQIGSAANNLVHTPPAPAPETFGDKDNFPYLTPYPGSTLKSGTHADGPLDVTVAYAGGSGNQESVLVGSGILSRRYQGPASLSGLQFVTENREALTKAGWTVLYPKTPKEDAGSASLIARYTRNGRDIWAQLFYQLGADLSYTVADVGAEDWAAKFDKDCRVPLYGVLFDFNKATLKPDSEPVLSKAAGLLKTKTGFNVEIQGHTDSVGDDASNLKLSDARAASVMQWLTAHSVPAARLTSKGYGRAQPVADNKTDEGRARNRRVELHKAGCGK